MTTRELDRKATEYTVRQSGSKRRSRVLTILASVVVFCVTYALILPALTWEKTLICELKEHTHTEACYELVTVPGSTELICTAAEHTHGEDCYTKTVSYLCGLEETAGHTHDGTCYDEEGTLICGLEESEGHTHDEMCTKIDYVLTCEQDEHVHDEACRHVTEERVEKVLTCTLPEHVHSEACFDAPPATDSGVYCGKSAHTHSEKCYTNGTLTCTLGEHEHTKQCFSDPSADLETAKTWEASLADVALTGNWGEDVVAIAASQLGNRESAKNYLVDDSGSLNGYTRYGAWYGSPYADWCAMFCSFCLHYAGVDTMTFPQAASCPRWIETLSSPDYDLYRLAADYTPKPGDLIFFDYDSYTDASKREANHVGIVAELIMDADGELAKVKTIEGNTGAGVASNTYSLTDGNILGYAELPLSPVERKLARAAAKTDGIDIELDCWLEVSEIDDISAQYMILSEYGYALGVGDGNTAIFMEPEMREIMNHPGYYTAEVPDSFVWTFDSKTNPVNVRNVGQPAGLRLSAGGVIGASDNLRAATLSYNTNTKYWDISYAGTRTYHLACTNTGTFSSATSTANSNMKIYKAVKLSNGGGGTGGNVIKPTYPGYRPVSDAMTGSTAIGTVTGTYWSDPSTSQLESQFNGRPADDGKVLSDKSVIYGDDDYDAFDTYAPNTFGVELSALGQKYAITQEMQVKVPLDVVFVLDTSGSMINTTYDGVTSANILVESLNKIMKNVMDDNEDNRVGVVCFSGCAHKLLDLGRYTADNDKFFPEGVCNSVDYQLTASNSIKRTDGPLYKGTFDGGWYGTFTQDGIAMGAQEFFDTNDTSLTKTVTKETTEGTLHVTYTVKRRPLIILLSDGEPTYCCSDYDDVLASSNVFGNGNTGYNNSGAQIADSYYSANNNKGILGFYTILTAQNYKDRIARHYNTDAYFYTIGIGMDQTGNNSYENSVAGDDYKRAVLNPTRNNINHLTECTTATCLDASIPTANRNISNRIDYTCRMMYRLLNNTQVGSTVKIGNHTSQQYGIRTSRTQTDVPIIDNPYVNSGYSYADGAFFTANNSVDILTKAFTEAISYSDLFPVYGFILKSNAPMDISDVIGDGMELKSEPVLRYGGENHLPTSHETEGNVTTYHYSGTYTDPYGSGQVADLSQIIAKVTTDETGRQTVTLMVPDSQLPTYTPNLKNDGTAYFYYEQLPVRLIYQVGLTDEAVREIENLQITGGSKTFYTNAWSEDANSFSYFRPTASNPYYQNDDYDTDPLPKSDNNTDTFDNSWTFMEDSDDTQVHEVLGNNGKLTFEPETFDVVPVTLWKTDANGRPVTTDTAIFEVYGDAEQKILIGSYETDEDGKLIIPNLRTDWTFYLKEVKAPYGYELIPTPLPFTVSATGEVTGIGANIYYRLNNDGELLIVNRTATRTVEAEKHWEGEPADGETYPDSVQVQLYADGEPVRSAVTLSAANDWYCIWEELPVLSETDKHEIVYTVEEINVPDGYFCTAEQDEDGRWILTNRRFGLTTVSVIKKWIGGEEKSVQVELLRNGEPTGRYAKLEPANNWYYIWEDLPDYDENGKIEYSIREITVNGFKPELHLWTGPGDPYGETGSKGMTQTDSFETGKTYLLVFDNEFDYADVYPKAALGSDAAHSGLAKYNFEAIEDPTAEMLWRANVESDGTVTFTNVGADKVLVLTNENKIALGSASDCHASSWGWYPQEEGAALVAEYSARAGIFTRTYTYVFLITTLDNGVGEASGEGYYIPVYAYEYENTITEDPVEPGETHYILINSKTDYEPPDLDLTIRKISSEIDEERGPTFLYGAKFDLYVETGDIADGQIPGTDGRVGKVVQSITVDGSAEIKLDEDGTYFLVETKAPAGYEPLDKAISFTVSSTISTRTAVIDYHPLIEPGTSVSSFDIPNTPRNSYTLPETGGIGTLPLYAGGVLLIAAALCLLYRRRRRDEHC